MVYMVYHARLERGLVRGNPPYKPRKAGKPEGFTRARRRDVNVPSGAHLIIGILTRQAIHIATMPNHIITEEQAGTRLDKVLVEMSGESRGTVQKWIDAETVHVDGKLMKKASTKLREGQELVWEVLDLSASQEEILVPVKEEARPVDTYGVEVISETKDYVVINKPSGLLVHPTDAEEANTLARWISETYPETAVVGEDPIRPGIMHRLDREASGLMVVARTQESYLHLKDQFKNREVNKIYTVLVQGTVLADHDTIDFDIDRGNGGRMAARPHTDMMKLKNVGKAQEGRDALTEFDVLTRYANSSLLKVKIHTGRTHQIRVHMFAYAHPVLGDMLYQQKRDAYKNQPVRLFLHASELGFADMQGEHVAFASDLPTDLQTYLDNLK